MSTPSEEYLRMLKQLLPPGPAFPRGDRASMVALMLEAWSVELARIDSRIETLISENDPRVSVEAFEDWCAEWGIPDVCENLLGDLSTVTLRQLLLFKITTIGGQSVRFFAELAKIFGYTIQIDEIRPYTVDSQVMDAMWSNGVAHTWRVNILTGQEDSTAQMHNTLGTVNEPLAWWGDGLLECLFARYKPAHTEVYYGYHGVA